MTASEFTEKLEEFAEKCGIIGFVGCFLAQGDQVILVENGVDNLQKISMICAQSDFLIERGGLHEVLEPGKGDFH